MESISTRRVFEPDFRALRSKHFGSDCPPLHRREIVHRKGRFVCLNDLSARRAWGDDFLAFVRRHSYITITATLDRVEWREKHGESADEYQICLFNILERYFYFLRDCNSHGDIVAEARNEPENQNLRDAYRMFWLHGPYDISAADIQSRFCSRKIHIKPKTKDIPGLQFVDLIASALKRSHLHDQHRLPIDDFSDFQRQLLRYLWSHKMYRSDRGIRHGYGLKFRP